ncbi:MAG: FG-GAP repeat protein [Planctomycetota bacterium]
MYVLTGGGTSTAPFTSSTLLVAAPDVAFFDQFGAALAWVDFNGDGIDDLLVGAPAYDIGEDCMGGLLGEGRVVLRKSNVPVATYFIDDPDPNPACHAGLSYPDGWGAALASGKLDNNAKMDLVIGNPRATDGGSLTNAGKIRVVMYH